MRNICIVIFIALVGACASKPTSPLGQDPLDNLKLTDVRLDVQSYLGSSVRWGGIITQVENKADKTWVELVSRALKKNDRPATEGISEGRFIASFDGFSDPMVYKVGQALTVIGSIEGETSRSIGEFNYSFPIVAVRESHLWGEETRAIVPYYPPSWWYYDMYYYHPFPHPYRRW